MEWEFDTADLVKGRVAYGIADFRRDLEQELRMNLGARDEAQFRWAYDIIYDLCHWLATGRPLVEFVHTLEGDPAAVRLAKSVEAFMHPNAEMLGAVLQRMIMDRVESGMPLEQTLDAVDRQHRIEIAGRHLSAIPIA